MEKGPLAALAVFCCADEAAAALRICLTLEVAALSASIYPGCSGLLALSFPRLKLSARSGAALAAVAAMSAAAFASHPADTTTRFVRSGPS